MTLDRLLPLLLGLAWLLPLASFAAIVFFGPRMGKGGKGAGYVATAAIGLAMVLSLVALGGWLLGNPVTLIEPTAGPAEEHAEGPAEGHAEGLAAGKVVEIVRPIAGNWYTLAEFGSLRLTIGYYIDALTVVMFAMVTLVAFCIHVYSFGYMHEELDEVTDPMVTADDGGPLRRPGRFHRFFQYLSLFCFSMLGLVVAGNLAMVFVFWELVGICSYFLIGFYHERSTATNAANKAFIVNRVGDFGMLVGLMALWGALGTLAFGNVREAPGRVSRGVFRLVRSAENDYRLTVPDRMVRQAARAEVEKIYRTAPTRRDAEEQIAGKIPEWRDEGYGYWLLVIAGLGIFCGCVGKSAQFPLHVWLPDAMEGPTPVSALIHAATMVAAGVYLVGRFYPVFTPEVLLVIAVVGCVTLFIAATIALVATDIKRVLAYSTVSQLGYMMFALGLGGWRAGLFHLVNHAFFKALLFLGSGSVIHATGTNEMPRMGGLLKKMPWTAYTMLAGCLAISGAGVPLVIGLSGYYSKDAILAQALSAWRAGSSPVYAVLCVVAMGAAALTAFYMFRLWYLTFLGRPRDHHVFEHAHESPKVMVAPLVVLAVFSVISGWPVLLTNLSLTNVLDQARPKGTEAGSAGGVLIPWLTAPAEHLAEDHAIHVPASLLAFALALAGFLVATAFYGVRRIDPDRVRRACAPVYRFLRNKWWFDELYGAVFVRPAMRISGWIAAVDREGIDRFVDGLAGLCRRVSVLDDWIDRTFVDRTVDRIAQGVHAAGLWLRTFQTGRLRSYVLLVAVGTVGGFIIVSVYWQFVLAGHGRMGP